MYKVRNTSLDKTLEKYGVKKVYELTKEQLSEVCYDGIQIPGESKKRTFQPKSLSKENGGGIDRFGTAQIIESDLTVSLYMSDVYWEQRHFDIATEIGFEDILKGHETGDQTMEVFAQFGMGFYNLRPGMEVEVDLTKRFIDEVLNVHPVHTVIKVTGDQEKNTGAVENLEDLGYKELQDLAKTRGIKQNQKKAVLISELQK